MFGCTAGVGNDCRTGKLLLGNGLTIWAIIIFLNNNNKKRGNIQLTLDRQQPSYIYPNDMMYP